MYFTNKAVTSTTTFATAITKITTTITKETFQTLSARRGKLAKTRV